MPQKDNHMFSSRRFLSLHLVGEAILVGAIVGVIITFMRVLLGYTSSFIAPLLSAGRTSFTGALFFIFIMAVMGIIASLLFKWQPMISGSGIPQVSAQLHGRIDYPWYKVLIAKFTGCIVSLGSGLTLGREGPSIQIGATVGDGVSHAFKRPQSERRYLITSGAAAGLASAFNAPLSGAMFALEELHRNLSPTVLIIAMISAYSSVFLSGSVLGIKPILHFNQTAGVDLSMYWAIILLGILMGLSGVVFNFAIIKSKEIFASFNIPNVIKPVISFVITGLIVLLSPELFGSGESLIFISVHVQNPSIFYMLITLFTKFCLLLIAFGSGLPGGIFFPLLVLGALQGNIFSHAGIQLGLMNADMVLTFVILAMCGHLSSIARAPLTAIVLVFELTESLPFMLPLGIVALVSYFTAELLRSRPIYDSLQEMIPGVDRMDRRQFLQGGRVLIEFAVQPNSLADGALIKDLKLPEHVLVISVRRGSDEVYPGGYTQLKSGDYLDCYLPQENLGSITRAMNKLVEEQDSPDAHVTSIGKRRAGS